MTLGATGGRVLVLGASGMLGHALIRELTDAYGLDVHGTVRHLDSFRRLVPERLLGNVHPDVDALDWPSVEAVVDDVRPDAVINCIGVIKQAPGVGDAATTIRLNALFPHLLAELCRSSGARLIQISTDCVFSGQRGGYREVDTPDPVDLYGRSKLLGEVTGVGSLTLRTSIIGHELGSRRSLLDWFLGEAEVVNGYRRAIYSGLPTPEMARVLATVVLPTPELSGLFHVASAPISKLDLLRLVADAYDWRGTLVPYDAFVIDRSLVAKEFETRTGYSPPPWTKLVADMRAAAARWGLLP